MPTALGTVQAFMAAFIEAWPTADTTALGSFFSERRRVSERSAGASERARSHRIDFRPVHESRW